MQQIPLAHLTATAEILSQHGITQDDFKNIRTDKNIAKDVARVLKRESAINEEMFHGYMADRIASGNLFGFSSWYSFFGQRLWEGINPSPSIPKNILTLLSSPCPFWKGKKVGDTHFLFVTPCKPPGHIIIPYDIGHQLNEYGIITKEARKVIDSHSCHLDMKEIQVKWNLLPIESIPMTSSKPFKHQLNRLPKSYSLADQIEELLKQAFYKLRVDSNKDFKPVHSLVPHKIGLGGSISIEKLTPEDHISIGTTDECIHSSSSISGLPICAKMLLDGRY